MSFYLFNIVLKVLARAIKHLKSIKGMQIVKQKNQRITIVDKKIYMSHTKNKSRELQLINSFRKVTGYKNRSEKSVYLFIQRINGL